VVIPAWCGWNQSLKDAPSNRIEIPGYPRSEQNITGNCPCEAGAVNSQVSPCNVNAVPSGWPMWCAGSLCGMLQAWEWSGVGPSTSWCVSYHLVCGNQSVCTEHFAMCVSQLLCVVCYNLLFYKYSTCIFYIYIYMSLLVLLGGQYR